MNDERTHDQSNRDETGGESTDCEAAGRANDETYTAEFDLRNRSAAQEVVSAVAEVKGVETDDLELIHEVVRPECLDRLFRPRPDGTPRRGGRVAFEYADCDIVVESGGVIRIRPRD
ncbi:MULTISPECIES: HalOD1 output domain-containing protein [Halorussus]|uniref:HalOD1 output domain-containing protein n=1 Tax=Halorussus TaxID=1070314 RepID=UPI00209ECD13|nr:HalOD1 output domain-containing protein [Halorussus vallis]USZ74266.1 hypothetical protein NGM07_12520 [Halorussus vallis]